MPLVNYFKYKCAVPHCSSKYFYPIPDPNFKNKKFHIFPSNPLQREKWGFILNIPVTSKEIRVCSDHFDGAANTNPNCYQFVSSLKTAILNSLIAGKSYSTNCEADDSSILDNLHSFLNFSGEPKPLVSDEENELINFCLTELDLNLLLDNQFDTQPISYVAGALVKKLNLDCKECNANLKTNSLEPHHTFTYFKENDDKRRLTYVTKEVVNFLASVHNAVHQILPVFGHIKCLIQKIIMCLREFINFDWFTCQEHKSDVFLKLLKITVPLIIRKYYNDLFRSRDNI